MKRARRQHGFTLIEVLVALGLLALLAYSITLIIAQLGDQRQRLEYNLETNSGLAIAFDQLGASLLTCEAMGIAGQSGVRGSKTSVSITVRSGGPAGGEERAGIFTLGWDAGSHDLTMTRHASDAPAPTETIASNIAYIRLRYHDGNLWQDEYDARTQGGLPHAVELSVWTNGGQDLSEGEVPSTPPDRVRIYAIGGIAGVGS